MYQDGIAARLESFDGYEHGELLIDCSSGERRKPNGITTDVDRLSCMRGGQDLKLVEIVHAFSVDHDEGFGTEISLHNRDCARGGWPFVRSAKPQQKDSAHRNEHCQEKTTHPGQRLTKLRLMQAQRSQERRCYQVSWSLVLFHVFQPVIG